MGKHKIVLLIGRSGSGKTAIANYLQGTYGWKAVDSYTTRPRRFPWETGHTFVSDDEFDQLTDLVAYTKFDGHRYCATAEQIDNADIYIVDLIGVKTMKALYQGDSVLLPVYVDVSPTVCMHRMLKRGDEFEAAWQRRRNDNDAFAGAKEYLNTHFDAVLSVKNRHDVSEAGDMIYKWATI